jgi:hypothetical protein
MDPKACLLRAREALRDTEIRECEAALVDYKRWRRKGGFEPDVEGMKGDDFLRKVAEDAEGTLRVYADLFKFMRGAKEI